VDFATAALQNVLCFRLIRKPLQNLPLSSKTAITPLGKARPRSGPEWTGKLKLKEYTGAYYLLQSGLYMCQDSTFSENFCIDSAIKGFQQFCVDSEYEKVFFDGENISINTGHI
jgi:hypothetical protein